MQRRKRHRLPDGRYLAEITPSVFHLQDVFGSHIGQLEAEQIELPSTLNGEQCEYENDPRERDQAR